MSASLHHGVLRQLDVVQANGARVLSQGGVRCPSSASRDVPVSTRRVHRHTLSQTFSCSASAAPAAAHDMAPSSFSLQMNTNTEPLLPLTPLQNIQAYSHSHAALPLVAKKAAPWGNLLPQQHQRVGG